MTPKTVLELINLNIFKSKDNFENLYLNKILKELNSKFYHLLILILKIEKNWNSLDIFYPNKKVKNLKKIFLQ